MGGHVDDNSPGWIKTKMDQEKSDSFIYLLVDPNRLCNPLNSLKVARPLNFKMDNF
jgi:hypothetical protein